MTLQDVREFSWAVSDWCDAQDDLAWRSFDPLEDGALVRIIWRDGRFAARKFTASEVRTMRRDDVAVALSRMALPGWLPADKDPAP